METESLLADAVAPAAAAPATGPPASGRTRLLHPFLIRWGSLVGQFMAVQVIVQAMGFVAGLLVIRVLSEREYAYYTLANTVLGALCLLADSGVGTGLSAIGGQVWQDPRRFGRLLATALRLRRFFVTGLSFIALPCLGYLLRSNGAGWRETGTLAALVLVGAALHLNIDVLTVVPRFCGHISRLQRVDLLGAGLRLISVAALACWRMDAALALAAPTAAVAAQNWLMRRYISDSVELGAPADPAYRKVILAAVRSLAPGAVFYCFQGQITVWIISLFGNPHNIAEVGALGRLAVIFTVVGTVQSNLVVPRFARCHDSATLWRRYFQIGAVSVLVGAALWTASALFPGPILLLLGSKYSHLRPELPLIVAGTVLHFIGGTLWSMNNSRAWVKGCWLNIPLTLGAQIVTLPFLDLSTVRGVLIFGLVPGLPTIALNLWLGLRGLRSTPILLPHEPAVEV